MKQRVFALFTAITLAITFLSYQYQPTQPTLAAPVQEHRPAYKVSDLKTVDLKVIRLQLSSQPVQQPVQVYLPMIATSIP